MSNRFVIILVAIVAIFLGLIFFTKQDAEAPSTQNATASEHKQGAGTAGVTLVEYGDFQCPACGGYYPLLKQVKEKYGDQITFQFRHFPIVGIHPNAMAAHRAAEAASLQDKFWEMHDVLYERQSAWTESRNPASVFRGYAEEIGLDMARYDTDVAKSEVAAVIQKDIQAGRDLKVSATPSFYLNGKAIESSPRSVDDFSKLIDEAIATKQ